MTKMNVFLLVFDDKGNHPIEILVLQPLVHEHLNDTPIVQNTDGSHMLSVDVVQTCVPKLCGHVIGAFTKRPSTKEEFMSLNMVFGAPMIDSRVMKAHYNVTISMNLKSLFTNRN
jgi:hypothetical protein